MTHCLEEEAEAWKGQALTNHDSPVHRLDPRGRLVVAGAFSVAVVTCHEFPALGAALALALILALTARLPPRATIKRVMVMDLFVVLMLLMLPFTVPGAEWFRLGEWTASWEGLLRALEIALKANAVILALLALVGTMETATLGHALRHLRIPVKLIVLFMFMIRYIEVLGREYHRLRIAMKARAFRPRGDLHTWRTFGYLMGMLLVRGLDRSERVMRAMKCRGFSGHFHLHDTMALRLADLVFGAASLLALGAMTWLNLP